MGNERGLVMDIETILGTFGGEVVVELEPRAPSTFSELFAVIGRNPYEHVVDRLLEDSGVELELMVEADNWLDWTVLDEVRCVLWFTDQVVTDLEYGRIQVKDSRWVVMKTPEPPSLRTPTVRHRTLGHLSVWPQIVAGGLEIMWYLDSFCVVCDGPMFHFDTHGLGWCDKHWKENNGL